MSTYLLHHGIQSPRGNPSWSHATLRGVLANPTYTGDVYVGRQRLRPARRRRSATHPIGKPAAGRDPAPPEEWTWVTTTPALVSQEAFDAVQAKLALNQQRASRNNKVNSYLLRALVSCAQCQSACTGLTTYSGYRYYRCWRSTRRIDSPPESRCQARYSPADQLDDLVWQDLSELLAHPESIAYALERAQGGHWLPQELQARKETLRKAQAALANQLERLTAAYLVEVNPLAEYQRRRHELEHKQHALTTQEKQLEGQINRQGELAGMVTSIEAFCQRVQVGLTDATFEQKRALVELLIDRVVVDHGEVEIRYVIPTAPRGETSHFYQLRKDYFEMPFIPGLWSAAAYLIGIILPELAAPFTDRFIGYHKATGEHHLLDIAIAEDETEVEPDGMRDDFRGKAVVLVALRVGSRGHVGSPQAVRWLIRGSITSSLCHRLAGLTTS